MFSYVRVSLVFTGLCLLHAAPSVTAAPQAVLWERWMVHDQASEATVNHQRWAQFLRKYVKSTPPDINRVTYAQVSEGDRQRLDHYLAALAAVAVSTYNRQEQLAYWINFYNALTVQVVLDHYPVSTMMDINISPGWFSVGPWEKKLVRVEGEMLSLDDIEHRILRPIWRDPRIHYALNCASYGCPDLNEQALSAAIAHQQLDAAAYRYINSDRGVLFEGDNLFVSKIYQWFKDDFGGTDAGVIAHLRSFASPALENRLAGARKIAGGYYDWSLNDMVEPVPDASTEISQFGRPLKERGSAAR